MINPKGENRNCTIFIEGRGGTGKSYIALKIGKAIDPNFNAETLINRIAFDPGKFLDIIDSNLPAGSVIIFDDAGVGLSARDWFDFTNKAIGKILQTYRHRNLVTIFTIQRQQEVDIQARKRADFVIWAEQIMRSFSLNVVKVYENVFYPGGRVLPTFIRVNHRILKWWYLRKVDDPVLCQAYEDIANPWKRSLVGKFKEEGLKMEEAVKRKERNLFLKMNPNRVCLDCNHQWHYSGHAKKPQCPSCKCFHTIEFIG